MNRSARRPIAGDTLRNLVSPAAARVGRLGALLLAGLCLHASPAVAQPIPVHEYRFPETARDSGSLATGHGTVGANVIFSATGLPGGIGQAAEFAEDQPDAASRITVPNADFVNFGANDFSIAFWAKRNDLELSDIDGVLDALGDTGAGWQVWFTTADRVSCRIDGTSSTTVTLTSAAAIADTNWHHYAITVTRGTAVGFKIFIDGVLNATGSTTLVTGNINPGQHTQIGGVNDTNGLEGRLALVQIYTAALSATEVAQLAGVGQPVHEYELEGNGVDTPGTANGAVGANVTFTSSGVPAALGQAAQFSSAGSSAADRIDVAQAGFGSFGSSGTGNFSISCWVKRDVNNGGNAGIFDALATDAGVQMQYLGADQLRIRIDDVNSNTATVDSAATITDLNWHHLLVTVDRAMPTTGIKWYIDGQLDGSGDPSVLTGAVTPDQDLQIGTINTSGLNGKLARLTFFNRALTAADAVNLADLDGDGVPYAMDVCMGFDDLGDDADTDGVVDACDPCFGTPNVDADTDGLCDSSDNCPMDASTNQTDSDGDGVGNVCDPCVGTPNVDADTDGLCDSSDNCPMDASTNQTDSDGDGVGNVCDPCVGTPNVDADTDGLCDSSDNCPTNANANQSDSDGDGPGDACDPCTGSSNADADADGICDEFDACPGNDALCSVPANVICVWAVAPGANNGSNWYNAYRSLTAALAAATSGKQIWVAEGNYTPDGGYRPTGGDLVPGSGNRALSFQMAAGVALYGGFLGNESLLSQRNVRTNVATLSGEIQGDANAANNSYHVVAAAEGDDATAVLDGFTIRGGQANGSGPPTYLGGGMFIENGSGTITDCSPTITNCTFIGNTAGAFGGGLYNYFASPTVTNCTFSGNTSDFYGGGMYDAFGRPTITNCTVSANAADLGAGMFEYRGAATFRNCIFGSSPSQLIDVDGGSVAVTYSIVQGGFAGTGNTSGNPLFVDASGPDNVYGTSDDNMRLQANSPAIDTGSNAAVPAGITTDRDGRPRFINCLVDRGAYERVSGVSTDADGDGMTDACDNCPLAANTTQVNTDGDGMGDACDACPSVAAMPGDLNGDLVITSGDIAGFVAVMLNPGSATAAQLCAADTNRDFSADGRDTQSFIELIVLP